MQAQTRMGQVCCDCRVPLYIHVLPPCCLQANLANDMQMLPTRVLTSPFPAKVFTLDDRKRQVALADSSPVAAAAAAAGKKLAEAGSSSPPAAKQPGVTLLGSQLHDIQALTQQPQSSPASVQPSQPSAPLSGGVIRNRILISMV